MSEIKLAPQASVQPVDAANDAAAFAAGNDVRLLTDLELALAGGGDLVVPWP